MNTLHHLLYACSFANAVSRSRRERRWLMLAAIAPDVDGVLFWNRALWEKTHHTVGHNLFFAVAITGAALLVARRGRRLRLAGLTAVSVLVFHYLLDLAISATWPMRPFWPFSNWDINLGNFVADPNRLDFLLRVPVQWTLVLIAFALAIHTYRRHGRTALELVSAPLDELLAGYLARMASGKRCMENLAGKPCGARAGFRCASCHHFICGTHASFSRLEAFCNTCRDGVATAS